MIGLRKEKRVVALPWLKFVDKNLSFQEVFTDVYNGGKVSKLQQKVEAFENFMQNTGKTVNELQDGLNFANEEREAFKNS